MVMRKTGSLKRNQVVQPHLAVVGQADEAPVYGLEEESEIMAGSMAEDHR